jgi:outer membrane protein OmpA-like peptidoglycan-associated protein/tetratricopeptide (TPR) repeat protein
MSRTKNLFFIKVVVLTVSLIFQCNSGYSQLPVFKREQRLLKTADKLFQEKDYLKALEKYRAYISRYEGNVDVWYRIASAYKEIGKPERSEIYYNRIINTDEQTNPIVHLSLGQVLMMQGKYAEARTHFQRYNELLEYNDQLAMRYISSIENIDKYFVDSSFFRKSNLPINSDASDFGAVALDNSFYFLSTRNTKDDFNLRYSSDLFVSNMNSEGSLFETPKKMGGPANTRFGEIGYAIVPETNEIFICRYEPGKENEYSLGYNLYKAYLGADKAITRPEKFESERFKYAIAYPTLSYDGKFIIFSSDAPGGFGGWDLYKAEFTDNGFDNIQNLGEKINSAGDELYPYLLNDSILFFATDGQGGLGGFDIYSKNLNSRNDFARNMGYPINSQGDDIGIYFDSGLSGYFTSNREGGKGNADIYKFTIHHLKLSGEVVDELNGENLKNVNIKIKRSTGKGEALALADNGKLVLEAMPGEELEITVEKEGYETKSFTVNTTNMSYIGSHSMEIGKLPVLKIVKEEPVAFEIAPEIIQKSKPEHDIIFGVQVLASRTRLDDETIKRKYKGPDRVYEVYDGKYYRYIIGKNSSYFLAKEIYKKQTNPKYYLVAFIDSQSERVMKALRIAYVEPAEARDPIVHEFIDKTNQIGSEIVYYGLDKFRIPDGSDDKLEKTTNALNQHPEYFLEIATHTDKRGSDMYNRALSEERAKFLYEYFIQHDINENRIIYHGIGEKQLKKYCVECTEADHEQNRRAELILRVYKEDETD